ncbi:hypothetical protein AMATHDRAFT_54145 [Amanita thiersii Skay4041]|uniref:U3 small nucleolar RNA-associated protein 25 n=1 Tax=Amanita thiersii Skay4041 TaxID=703135 RepID=A0A2A9NZX0_9AGAR|nr:hypothetical protein AMATHDRAFT_54145 [Amanita thiersii Skay4041]
MTVVDDNLRRARLLSKLNESSSRARKKKRTYDDRRTPPNKSSKNKSVRFSDLQPEADDMQGDLDCILEANGQYENHFGPYSAVLSESSRDAADKKMWESSREQYRRLGYATILVPQGAPVTNTKHTSKNDILDKLKAPLTSLQSKQSPEQTEFQDDLLSILSTRRDLYLTSLRLNYRESMRQAVSLHVLNHVTTKRRRVLKNNERLANHTKTNPHTSPPEDVQDQGFTRPSTLILLPFRSSALDWYFALTSHTPSYQIENQSRFVAEYGLPPDVVDKLTSAEPGTYPLDHIETFRGNVDDNFRAGIKITRKSVKMFSEFYESDIIIASPLGLRRSIEKEKGADYLSSIEILIIDQMDTLTMQNWDHVKFIVSYLNQLPKESHNTDFSRVKPWYLDGHSIYLRQSILISAYETPETRSLYNSALKNVAGKIKTENYWPPIEVPEGISQKFVDFDCWNAKDEPEKRFRYFTTQLLPAVLKSAVQSTNTAIFIPSSFDFIRVHNYFRKHAGVSFVVLSEYSTNQDISRARQAFFHGKKSFLLISERFHFYKRYKIRGIRNFIFYGPPDHPQFFTELLSFPFLEDDVEPSDVTCQVLYSKYDWFKMERITGTEAAVELIKGV